MKKLIRPNHHNIILVYILVLSFLFISPNQSYGQVDISVFEETLDQISDDEKTIIEELFILSQEIEGMMIEEEEAGKEIELLKHKIPTVEESIDIRQKKYDKELSILQKVLVSYQRRGPATFIETILNSKNLTDFIKNINIIRELSHNTGDLLNSLEEEKILLAIEKENLSNSINLLKVKREELQIAISNKVKLKEEQEDYLNSLKEEREFFEQQLNNMEQMWEEIKVLFSQVIEEYTMILTQGYFPLEDFNIRFGLGYVKGSIYDDKLNSVIEQYSKLPNLKFNFTAGKVSVEIPEKQLSLGGTFTIQDGSALKFEPTEGTFYDMVLQPSSLRELFRDGYLLIDFSKFIGDINVKSVKIQEGFIEFEVSPFL